MRANRQPPLAIELKTLDQVLEMKKPRSNIEVNEHRDRVSKRIHYSMKRLSGRGEKLTGAVRFRLILATVLTLRRLASNQPVTTYAKNSTTFLSYLIALPVTTKAKSMKCCVTTKAKVATSFAWMTCCLIVALRHRNRTKFSRHNRTNYPRLGSLPFLKPSPDAFGEPGPKD